MQVLKSARTSWKSEETGWRLTGSHRRSSRRGGEGGGETSSLAVFALLVLRDAEEDVDLPGKSESWGHPARQGSQENRAFQELLASTVPKATPDPWAFLALQGPRAKRETRETVYP